MVKALLWINKTYQHCNSRLYSSQTSPHLTPSLRHNEMSQYWNSVLPYISSLSPSAASLIVDQPVQIPCASLFTCEGVGRRRIWGLGGTRPVTETVMVWSQVMRTHFLVLCSLCLGPSAAVVIFSIWETKRWFTLTEEKGSLFLLSFCWCSGY